MKVELTSEQLDTLLTVVTRASIAHETSESDHRASGLHILADREREKHAAAEAALRFLINAKVEAIRHYTITDIREQR
jgi:hypothetical protein